MKLAKRAGMKKAKVALARKLAVILHRVALVRRGRLAFAGNSSTVRQRENAS